MSLRDVERTMVVFKYFYEMMDVFAPLIDQKQQEEMEDRYDEASKDEGIVKPLASLSNCLIMFICLPYISMPEQALDSLGSVLEDTSSKFSCLLMHIASWSG